MDQVISISLISLYILLSFYCCLDQLLLSVLSLPYIYELIVLLFFDQSSTFLSLYIPTIISSCPTLADGSVDCSDPFKTPRGFPTLDHGYHHYRCDIIANINKKPRVRVLRKKKTVEWRGDEITREVEDAPYRRTSRNKAIQSMWEPFAQQPDIDSARLYASMSHRYTIAELFKADKAVGNKLQEYVRYLEQIEKSFKLCRRNTTKAAIFRMLTPFSSSGADLIASGSLHTSPLQKCLKTLCHCWETVYAAAHRFTAAFMNR